MNVLNSTILIMDDEPHVLDWLIEYLNAKGYKVDLAVNVDEAINKLNENSYRVTIFDLNVPASDEVMRVLKEKGEVYAKYRGLFAAEYARSKGHRGRQVVVYSVHDAEDVQALCQKVGTQYLIKARPREFKKELDDILSFDPTQK